MAFDAFISYSHSADGEFAPALQKGLQQLAKPWTRRRALRIFRDDTGLSVNPALWQSITDALDESEYFVLLASPGAAQSEWVGKEIEYWTATKPDGARRILPVLTEGTFVWNAAANDIDWGASDAAHPALAGVFTEEPRHLDFVWARTDDDLNLRNSRYRDAVADIAAPIHGIPKDELEGEDIRQHRRAVLARRTAIAALIVLFLGVSIAGFLANRALRDLEDANGNITDLEERRTELETLNADAEARLAAANDAIAIAEAATAEAQVAQLIAETAQADAETAQAAAETAQARADELRAEAAAARAVAEAAQADAEVDAATAREAEADAVAKEAAAVAAQAVADQAAAAAAAAASAASKSATAATLAANEAATAQAQAEEAQITAEAAQTTAEAAALAASLEAAAAGQTASDTAALLSAESYCAVDGCTGSGLAALAITTVDLAPMVPMLDVVTANQDLVRTLPGFDRAVSDVAISDDGATIAALGQDGSIRVWDVAAPDGAERREPNNNVIGFTLSDDGSTIAIVTSRYYENTSGGPQGLEEDVVLLRVSDGAWIDSNLIDWDTSGAQHTEADVRFAPGSTTTTLVNFGGHLLISDSAFDFVEFELNEPPLAIIPISGGHAAGGRPTATVADWRDDAEVMLASAGEVHLWDRATDTFAPLPVTRSESAPTSIARAGTGVTIGYLDGTVVRQLLPGTFAASSGHSGAVVDVATTVDELATVAVGSDGAINRIGGHRLNGSAQSITDRTSATVAVDTALATNQIVIGRGETVEVRTGSLSWNGATAWVANGGGFRNLTSAGGVVFGAPADPVSEAGVGGAIVAPGVNAISADGSTVVRTDPTLRVEPLTGGPSIELALPLDESYAESATLTQDGALVGLISNGGSGKRVRVHRAADGQLLTDVELRPHQGQHPSDIDVDRPQLTTTHIAIRRTDRSDTSYLRDDQIEVYDLSGALVLSVEGVFEGDGWLLTPDGLLVATADGPIVQYPFDGGDPVVRFDVGRLDHVASLAILADDPDLVAVGYDSGTIELWDASQGTFIIALTRHNGSVSQLELGRVDGALVVSSVSSLAFSTQEVVVRTLDPAVVRRAACTIAGRDLTETEWRRYVGPGDPLPCTRGLPE